MKHLNQFFGLRSSGDILSAVAPINHGPKEITEAMGIREILRKITLREPMEFTLIDLCSGNCLIPIIAAFTLPVKEAIGVDLNNRERPGWSSVRRFTFCQNDIHSKKTEELILGSGRVILTSCHCCRTLAKRVIALSKLPNVEHFAIMPCCVGQFEDPLPMFLHNKIDNSTRWALYLNQLAGGSLTKDEDILSPRNLIITGP